MAFTYKSHKGRTYYLCIRRDDKGHTQYVLSRKIVGQQAEKVPDGYEIGENENGQVTVFKAQQPIKAPVTRKRKAESQQKTGTGPHPPARSANTGQEEYSEYPLEACPVCNQTFRSPKLKWHIRDMHPHYTPTEAIIASRLKDPNRREPSRRRHRIPLTAKEMASKARENALDIQQTECGWCYQVVYCVWQANGYNKYYDDKDLYTRHRCTRPVHWDPDH
jgi:hypothetical protein